MGKIPLVAITVLLLAPGFSEAKSPTDPEQVSFARLSGKELVAQLADDKKRPRAFFELLRRAEPGKHTDFKTFEAKHYNTRLVVCPSEKSQPPIYLVLYGFLDRTETGSSFDEYSIKNPSELFPPADPGPADPIEEEPAICAFTAEGRVVRPFGNNTILEYGTISDINGDGVIERVDSRLCGVEGVRNVSVLTVSAVETKAEPLLTVVLNWDNDEWIYRLTDQDGDGVSDIEAGPRTKAGLTPKAIWKWDRTKHAYVGPQGEAGDHFRVINGATLWKELARLKAARLTFPKDGDAVSTYEAKPESIATPTPSPQGTTPFRYASLKDAPNSELLRFMAQGKKEWDRQPETENRTRLPENFWNMEAKTAALALVEANRTEVHRSHYQIAIDDRDKAEAPQRCTISFSDASARCYQANDGHYFLRVDPDDSYLAFAGSSSAGVVFYNAVYDQPVFDLRICPLPYEEARKIGQVIWWLDRVRTRVLKTESQTSAIVSSGDGSGHLVMRAEDRAVIDYSTTLGGLGARWTDHYAPKTFVNLAGYLIANALPARLGNKWSQFEPTEQRPSEMRQDSAPVYTDAERKRLQDFSERFLGWFSLAQEKASFSIVSVAAQFAGDFGITSDATRLREIEATLPPPAPPKRTYDEVEADRNKLPRTWEIKDAKKRKRVEERLAALDAEQHAILYDDVSGSPEILRKAIATSLRELAVATDADRLSVLAVSKSDDQQWALRCLGQLDRQRYADALETLTRKTKEKWARQFYGALAQVDRARAATIARELPPEKIDPLTIPAFLVLAESGAVPEEAQRLGTIIKILLDPKTGWQERADAVRALVPENNPLRYPGQQIDDALLKVLVPEQADESGTFTQEEACLALARRGRTESFDSIVEQLQKTRDDASSYGRFLQALAHLAESDPGRFNPRLVEIIRPHLSHTNKSVPGLIWIIWCANLHDLQSEIERLATASREEFEDLKASSYGGTASDVTGRFHLARKILSLWSEPDPLTRAKLLVALCASEAEEFFRNPHPERLARMKVELNRAADELSPDARNALKAFISAIDSNPDSVNEATVESEMVRKAAAFALTELRL